MKRYTAKQLAELSGTSVRTLHYYEEVGLLHPERRPNGYRSYGPADVERLGQVLAMRACRMPLAEVRQLLEGSDANAVKLLARHLEELRAQERQVKEAVARTRAAMELLEGVSGMSTKESFEALKQRQLEEFERSHGDEARERYGADVIDQTNERLMGLSRAEWDEKDRLEKRITELLAEAKAGGDPRGPKARELCLLHQRWIKIHWGEESYSAEAHRGLAKIYLADRRFTDYYDGAAGAGATEFLVDVLEANL